MSHFCGIVFGHENDLDSVLAPFDENKQVEEYVSMTAEAALKWARKRAADIKERCVSEGRYSETLKKYNNFESEEDLKNYIKGYWETLDEEGNVLSTYNPDSEWDWWVIGGRWSNEVLHQGELLENRATIQECTQIDTPFCFIDLDGNWHKSATMGWWGITSDEKEEDEWENEFREYLNSVPKDTVLTVIDFHI